MPQAVFHSTSGGLIVNKKRIALFGLVFFSAGVTADYVYHQIAAHTLHTGQCTAYIVVFQEAVRANLALDFMYNEKKRDGVVSVSGSYAQNNRLAGTIRRDVSYRWEENGDAFSFLSTNVNKFAHIETLPDDLVSLVMPDFYVYPDKRINYTIQPQGEAGFLFTIGKRPLFFCAR